MINNQNVSESLDRLQFRSKFLLDRHISSSLSDVEF